MGKLIRNEAVVLDAIVVQIEKVIIKPDSSRTHIIHYLKLNL